MDLDGLHHVTAITADASGAAGFYSGVLGLREVGQGGEGTPELWFGDDHGSPGSLIALLDHPTAAPGHPGGGMVHTVIWRVGSDAAVDFWAARLERAGRPVTRRTGSIESSDPEGLGFELQAVEDGDPPLRAAHPEIPPEHALAGLHGVRAYTKDPAASERVLKALNFAAGPGGITHRVAGEHRHAVYVYDHAPAEPGVTGAGTVQHVAWAARDEDHSSWRTLAQMAGVRPSEIADRRYFRTITFREPSGVRFEIASRSPGFGPARD